MLWDDRIRSKEEIRKEIQSYLDEPRSIKMTGNHKPETYYLSITGKKRNLTKWIKESEEYYNSVLKAVQSPLNERYYLGDFITYTIVLNAKRDVQVMKEMRAELDKKEGA
jgi:hypothetical protein